MSRLSTTAARLAAVFGSYGSVTITRDGASAGSVTMGIIVPGTTNDWQVLRDLGGERATARGDAAPGVDIRNGDKLTVGSVVYMVEGVRSTPQLVMCALSEVGA